MGVETGELLTGLSVAELAALADGVLAPARQGRLDELLARGGDGSLSAVDAEELDRLLELADPLKVLKTWARYTLARSAVGVTEP